MATPKVTTMTFTEADALSEPLPPRGARCRDCDKDTTPLKANGRPNLKAWNRYIASDEVWIEAGMARKRWTVVSHDHGTPS